MSKLLIVDAFSIAFRAFYAMPPLSSKEGIPVNAIYGFFSMVLKAYTDMQPSHMIVCFDHPQPTFRHDTYTGYKAQRTEAPDEFIIQIPLLKEAIANVGLVQDEYAGFEADDLLGTYSKLAEEMGYDCLLLTSDQDCWQLISEKTKVISTASKTGEWVITGLNRLNERLGISPAQITDYKGLKGDASDNIPGVKGVGEKTALKLLDQFSSLENIYKRLDEVSSKSLLGKLENAKEMAFLSKQLATILREVPVQYSLSQLSFEADWAKFLGLFERYDFKSLHKKYIPKDTVALPQTEAKMAEEKKDYFPETLFESYQSITDLNILKAALPLFEQGFAFDLETTALNPIDAQVVGISIAITAGKAYYLPCNEYLKPEQGSLFGESEKIQHINPVLKILKPLFENPKIAKTAHHAKFETAILAQYGISLKGLRFDTYIAAHLLGESTLGLKALTKSHLGISMTAFEDLFTEVQRFEDLPLEHAQNYACADADMCLRLRNLFQPIIHSEYAELFESIEIKLVPILAQIEENGVKIDSNYLQILAKEFETAQSQEAQIITEIAGESFNLNSTQQLGKILYEKLELPIIKKTKTGASTDSSVLEQLDHPICKHLLSYRQYSKLLSTYVLALPKLLHPKSGKVHAHFNQCITATGRLSSNHPNLQNIPIRSQEGQKIRAAFVSDFENGQLVSIDYSQIELRLLAHLADEKNLIQAFLANRDIHQSTAAEIFQVNYETVTSQQRDIAKTVNFGITYGQGARALAKQLDISQAEAKTIIENYHAQFPRIQAFIDESKAFAHQHEHIITMFGRKRNLADINSSNMGRRALAERMAVNTCVQGSAAEIMKLGMIETHNLLVAEKAETKMLVQVHDELVFDIPQNELATLVPQLVECLETVVSLKVPLKVSVGQGKNWQEAK